MKWPMLTIMDGGGTIWYSMDVLYEHAQAAFSFFGLLRFEEFSRKMPFDQITEISSFKSFNSRKNFPKALLALYFTETDTESLLKNENPEMELHKLVFQSWERCSRHSFEHLVEEMGNYFVNALYSFNDELYPLCDGVAEGLPRIRNLTKYLVVLSNRLKSSTEAILQAKGVLEYFDEVIAPEQPVEKITKPIMEVLEKYGKKEDSLDIDLIKSQSVFIGDSNLDIASANKQGPILTIATLKGMGSERVLMHERPYKIENTLVDAANVIEEIGKDPVRHYKAHIENLK